MDHLLSKEKEHTRKKVVSEGIDLFSFERSRKRKLSEVR